MQRLVLVCNTTFCYFLCPRCQCPFAAAVSLLALCLFSVQRMFCTLNLRAPFATVRAKGIITFPHLCSLLLCAGSDGLWDNCFETEVAELLPRESTHVQAAANRIANMARAHAEDPDFPSPYTREALSQGWVGRDGGGLEVAEGDRKAQTDGRMDKRTEGRTDGWSDGQKEGTLGGKQGKLSGAGFSLVHLIVRHWW